MFAWSYVLLFPSALLQPPCFFNLIHDTLNRVISSTLFYNVAIYSLASDFLGFSPKQESSDRILWYFGGLLTPLSRVMEFTYLLAFEDISTVARSIMFVWWYRFSYKRHSFRAFVSCKVVSHKRHPVPSQTDEAGNTILGIYTARQYITDSSRPEKTLFPKQKALSLPNPRTSILCRLEVLNRGFC